MDITYKQDCSLGASPILPPLLPFPAIMEEGKPEIPTNGEARAPSSTNLLSFFPKFELRFPFFNQQSVAVPGVKESLGAEKVIHGGGDEDRSRRPDVVTFPRAEWAVPTPLEAEVEESGKTSNPVVLWQVYALGGFLVVRWVWARWNERRAGQKKSDDGEEKEEDDDDNEVGDGGM